MLSAYMSVAADEQCDGNAPSPLTIITHLPAISLTPSVVTPQSCRDDMCERCQAGMGGYTFRWYHHTWHDVYVRMARAGSWVGPKVTWNVTAQRPDVS